MESTIYTNNLDDLHVSVTVANGGCYFCGKEVEFPDHNSCNDCRERQLADTIRNGTEVFDA